MTAPSLPDTALRTRDSARSWAVLKHLNPTSIPAVLARRAR